MIRFASSPSTRWSIGLMTFPKMSLKKYRRGATLQASPCLSIYKTLLISTLARRGSYRCDFERRENAGHFSAKSPRGEAAPAAGAGRLAGTAHSNRQQRGNKQPTVSQITATQSIVPN